MFSLQGFNCDMIFQDPACPPFSIAVVFQFTPPGDSFVRLNERTLTFLNKECLPPPDADVQIFPCRILRQVDVFKTFRGHF